LAKGSALWEVPAPEYPVAGGATEGALCIEGGHRHEVVAVMDHHHA
jgi:hypothetical protein